MKHLAALAAAVAGALALAAPARANIIFDPNPGPAIPGQEQVVIFEQPALTPGLVIQGDTNKSQTPVFFDTDFLAGTGPPPSLGGNGTGQFIVSQGIGHSNLVCTTGGTGCGTQSGGGANGAQLTSMEIRPNPGTAWGDMLVNLDFGEGTANIYVKDNLGNNFDFTLGNGQNKFSLLASNGEVITDVQISQKTGTTGPFGWNELKEVDISGACTLTGNGTCTLISTVPEPGTLALLATGLLGLGWTRWRRG